MSRTRLFGLLPLALVAAAAPVARAQFEGPAPLAWRWQQFSNTPSGGSPLVEGDRIYTALGNRIYCIDRLSGNQIWRFPNAEPIEGNFRTTPLMVDGVLVASSDNKNVYGVDPQSGALKWVVATPLPVLGNPIPVGRNVGFLMQGNTVQGVDVQTGATLYSAPLLLKDRVAGQVAGAGGNLIYFTQTNELVAVDFGTQKAVWRKRFTQLPQTVQPVVSGDTIYTFSGQYLVGLLASSGATRFQTALPERPYSAPIIGASTTMVLTDQGHAYFLDPNGTITNRKPIEIGYAPIVPGSAVGKKFLVPTSNGAVNLLDPATGKIDWSFIMRPASEGTTTTTASSSGTGAVGAGGNIGRTQTGPQAVLSVQAAAPAVLAGTTLLVPARDGSILAFDREIGVDLTAPDVRIVWPVGGDDVSGQAPLELIFKISDEASGLKLDTLSLDIDGTPYETEFTKDGFLLARIGSTGKNKPLANGRRIVTVQASDWMGNTAKKVFTLNIDNSLKPLVRPTSNSNGGGADGGGRPGMSGGLGGPGGGG